MYTERRHTEREEYALLTPHLRDELHRAIESVAERASRTVWYCEWCDEITERMDALARDARCKRSHTYFHSWRALPVNA